MNTRYQVNISKEEDAASRSSVYLLQQRQVRLLRQLALQQGVGVSGVR